MSNIIPLSTLAELLARKADISVDRATELIRAYFDAIEEALSSDKKLTIADLGTFDIEDEDTVRFNPATEFASRVNEAYEIFPSIELDSDIDINQIEQTQHPLQHQIPEPETEPETETETGNEVEPEPEEKPKPEPEEIIVDNPVEAVEETGEETENVEEVSPEPEEIEQHIDEEPIVYETEDKRCCTALYIILATLIALIIGIIVGYLGRHRIEAFLNSSETSPETPETNDSIIVDNTDNTIETIEIDTSAVKLTEADIAEINEPETATGSDDPTTEPTVRYDTVTGKRFLTTMAREYFGHQDYWSYIYLANKAILKHPDRIRPGTRVVIPEFDTFKTSDDPEQNRNDARRKGVEIYNHFK